MSIPILVRVKNKSQNDLPEYETLGSAGLDVRANEYVIIKQGETALVKTGLFLEIPEGYYIKVVPRSGLAYKNQVTVLNTPGTCDSDYRGEIDVILINHGHNTFDVKAGDRIAQLILEKFERIEWDPVSQLTETERGSGGFGSTGR